MPRYHTSVNVTQQYVSALIAEPQDREQRLRPMFEAEGATLLTLYFSPDEAKLIVLWEAPDPASLDALFLAVMGGWRNRNRHEPHYAYSDRRGTRRCRRSCWPD